MLQLKVPAYFQLQLLHRDRLGKRDLKKSDKKRAIKFLENLKNLDFSIITEWCSFSSTKDLKNYDVFVDLSKA
jgi:hypothetical protein